MAERCYLDHMENPQEAGNSPENDPGGRPITVGGREYLLRLPDKMRSDLDALVEGGRASSLAALIREYIEAGLRREHGSHATPGGST